MTAVALIAAAMLAASPAPPASSPAPPAATAPPAAPAAPAPPDGTYVYELTVAGQPSTSTIKVKRDADGLHISEDSEIASHAVNAALVLNASTLAPVSYAATYDAGTSHPQDISITFTANAAHVATFGLQTTLAAQPGAPHLVLLDGAMPSGFFALPAVAAAARDASLTAINAGALSAIVLSLNRSLSLPRPASVPAGDVAVSVLSPTAFSVWYDPKTFVMHELDVPLQNVVEKFVKYVAAAGTPSAVALARQGEHRRNARYSAAVMIARF
ncbi:MAG TPA: hypothetical protein VII69_00160 [Candidatus Eremiobacteraceae bacterium]